MRRFLIASAIVASITAMAPAVHAAPACFGRTPTIVGTAHNDGDLIEGAGGDDDLDGQELHDTLDGGAGTDACRNAENRSNCEGSIS